MKKSEIVSLIKEALKEEAPKKLIPADVANLAKAQKAASGVAARQKNINQAAEFEGAFQTWFQGLGFQPGRISKSVVRTAVEKVLTGLGYK